MDEMVLEFPKQPQRAVFSRRVNRFVVEAELAGRTVLAHLPNSGRLTAVLQPGRSCWLRPAGAADRKTGFDLLAVDTDLGTILVDSQLANHLVHAALTQRLLQGFQAYDLIRPEYRYGGSRLDFALSGEVGPTCLLEVKSAADYHDRVARFPDAPSLRAAKHLRELTAAAAVGYRAVSLFLAQMQWAEAVQLNESIDPLFVQAAREALAAGVELLAFTVVPGLPQGVGWGRAVPILVP